MNQSFSIRVTNDARSTKSSSWIKTVTLKMPNVRVNLGQKMRVKVNGTRVMPPLKLDNLLDIQRTDEGISVLTEIGINLLWDGSNFLQIQAATSYKKKLCGLCGNYSKCIYCPILFRPKTRIGKFVSLVCNVRCEHRETQRIAKRGEDGRVCVQGCAAMTHTQPAGHPSNGC